MSERLTIRQVAEQSGVPADELRAWQRKGLLPAGDDGLGRDDVERAGLIRFAVGRGLDTDELARLATRHGDMIGHFVQLIRPYAGERIYTKDEAAARVGLDPDQFARAWSAEGLSDQMMASEEDVRALEVAKLVLSGVMPVEAVLQVLRVFSDALNKVADAASRLFHLYVHDQMRSGGAGGVELLEETSAMSRPLLDLVEPAVLHFHRKAWERALREDMMLHLAEESTAPGEVPGQFRRAILFADLSSFTPLTEAMGDAAAAQVIERFSELVREAAARASGQVVKQIGDEFMLVFPDGRRAVECGLAIAKAAAAESRFPALRMGAHWGPVLYREGDYLGTNVNLAARVTATARRDQFLVTQAVAADLDGSDVVIAPIGAHQLKGLKEPVQLFEVRVTVEAGPRAVDPVCGMELGDRASEVDLHWRNRHLQFCSEACLRLFIGDPDRYELHQGASDRNRRQ